MVLCGWGQEDVEDHSKEHKDDIAHYTQPETWVFEQLLVVSAEEDVTDGHPGHNSSKMSHKGHLVGEKCEVSELITQVKLSIDPPPPTGVI